MISRVCAEQNLIVAIDESMSRCKPAEAERAALFSS